MTWQPRKPSRDILTICFNQDASCFSCAMPNGFKVFTSEPCRESVSREFENGGFIIAEMLFRSNILALVGGGPVPKYPPTKVMMWDDHQGRAVGELAFKTPVKAVRMRKDRIAVALESKVFLYCLEELHLQHTVETSPNPDGLLALSPGPDGTVLACPGLNVGQVRVDLLDTRRVKIIEAHKSPLAAIALTSNGRMVATASENGTLVRIFSCGDGTKLRELRRGSDPSRIYNLAFSRGDQPDWLALTSDKGTAHVFDLRGNGNGGGGGGGGASTSASGDSKVGGSAAVVAAERQESGGSASMSTSGSGSLAAAAAAAEMVAAGTSPGKRVANKLTSLVKRAPVGGAYFASERSWSKYTLPDGHRTVVAFGREPGTLYIASVTGAFHHAMFDVDKKGAAETAFYTMFWESKE